MPLLFQFIDRLALPELYILTIGLCAAGLVLLPEIFYVKDIYTGLAVRANTMFKFTYQSFIMFGMMMGYVVTKFVLLAKNKKQLVCGIVTGFLLLGTVGYLDQSVESWFGDVKDKSRFQGLDAALFVEDEIVYDYDQAAWIQNPNIYDAEAVDWINANIKGRPVLLEANGTSYTYECRISVLTGLPTILGWNNHEWLWKNDGDLVAARSADVQTIYTSTDETTVRSMLEEYDVSYIYVGDVEREKFAWCGGVNETLIRSMGEIVFENEGVYIVEVK